MNNYSVNLSQIKTRKYSVVYNIAFTAKLFVKSIDQDKHNLIR
jgi:hypothetical protein